MLSLPGWAAVVELGQAVVELAFLDLEVAASAVGVVVELGLVDGRSRGGRVFVPMAVMGVGVAAVDLVVAGVDVVVAKMDHGVVVLVVVRVVAMDVAISEVVHKDLAVAQLDLDSLSIWMESLWTWSSR